jgi:hypothetical protein
MDSIAQLVKAFNEVSNPSIRRHHGVELVKEADGCRLRYFVS